MELVLAGAVGRGAAYAAALPRSPPAPAIAAGSREFAGFVAGGLPLGGSAYLALATASVVPVFVGVGALASQLAPTRRIALELGSAVDRRCALLLRVIADTVARRSAGCAGRRRSAGPRSCARSPAPRPLVLLLPAVASALLLGSRRRGSPPAATSAPACCPARRQRRARACGCSPRRPRRRCAASAAASSCGSACVGAFALDPRHRLHEHLLRGHLRAACSESSPSSASGSIATPTGYLAFVFIFFILAVSLFACAQIGAARHEEAERAPRDAARAAGRPRRGWLARAPAARARRPRAAISLAGRPADVGRRGLAGRPHLAAADARGRRQLPAGRAAVPRVAALAYALVPRAERRASPTASSLSRSCGSSSARCSARPTGSSSSRRSRTSGSCPRSRSAPPPRRSCWRSACWRSRGARGVPAARSGRTVRGGVRRCSSELRDAAS